jgi:hypothetical protein
MLQKKLKQSITLVFILSFNSIKEAAAKLDVNITYISACCHGRLKTSGGYINGNSFQQTDLLMNSKSDKAVKAILFVVFLFGFIVFWIKVLGGFQ